MEKLRIQVYADRETKRRIELAAAKRRQAVTDYCLDAIKEQLSAEDMLEAEAIEVPVKSIRYDSLIRDLRNLRAAILSDRDGGLLDAAAMVDQVREERDNELTRMC